MKNRDGDLLSRVSLVEPHNVDSPSLVLLRQKGLVGGLANVDAPNTHCLRKQHT